jgi:hypothetical protein
MSKRTHTCIIVALTVVTVFSSLSGCTPSSGQSPLNQPTDQATPAEAALESTSNVPYVFSDEIELTKEDFLSADLIVEGIITGKQTHWVTDTTATEAELADRRARGLSTGTDVLEYQVAIDKVWNGQAPAATIVVAPASPTYEVGDHAILFLEDISGDPIRAPGQTKYAVMTSAGQFRIEKDNTLSSAKIKGTNPMVDAYRGKDKSVLEQDIQDLVAKLPQPTKADVLQQTLQSSGIVIIGTVQDVQDVHFVNSLEKSQKEIDQLLAEGKMPGLLLTDYAVTVDKVLYDMRGDNPRFFPDWKPLQPGQTIIVTRQGGTYKGVTKIEEAGPAFETGQQEVLFLSNFSLTNYDLPDDGQARYSTDARLGRLLIGPDGNLVAFTTRGLGGFFGGQSVEQLEKDLAEFLKAQPPAEMNSAPAQP